MEDASIACKSYEGYWEVAWKGKNNDVPVLLDYGIGEFLGTKLTAEQVDLYKLEVCVTLKRHLKCDD